MKAEFVLASLFRHVVHKGFPLSVRDYQEALQALRQTYGCYRRQDLHWLCETLWARTEEEVRQLDLLFRDFPEPTLEEIHARTGRGRKGDPSDPGPAQEEKAVEDSSTSASRTEQDLQVHFSSPSQTGWGLPQAQVQLRSSEPFVFEVQPPIGLRALIVIWRRFRLALRSGPGVELDIEQTVRDHCRHGVLTAPALRPARRNQATLLVLVDASPSMVPWQHFFPVLSDSLHDSQLGDVRVFYFHNVPEEVVYEKASLVQPVAVYDLLQHCPDRPLLILSDAGAARGTRSSQRADTTVQFLTRVSTSWRPVVWANPMPRHRWRGSTAEQIKRLAQVTMVELTEDGLVLAVDVLRGQRNG